MELAELTKGIRAKIRSTRFRSQVGNDSELLVWLLDGSLACSTRPLRDHPDYGGRNPLPPEARTLVEVWVEQVRSSGIRSIVSLLEEAQHEKYYIRGGLELHPDGLYGYYRSQGFEFRHIPMADYQEPSEDDKERVLRAFDQLPKPVLVHCSAGIDRTSPVAAYIASKRDRWGMAEGFIGLPSVHRPK